MTPDLVLLIFLPALLFEASWNLDFSALRRDWLAITVLATVGVVVCMSAVAVIMTRLNKVEFYEDMVSEQEILEST